MSNGLYGIGMSALIANQYALELASQNLANVNTPGYTRQIPLFSSRDYAGMPAGVNINGSQRMSDNYINHELRNAISTHYQMQTYFQNAERMDTLVSNEMTDLSLTLQQFFSGLQNLNSDPASFQSREVFMNEMELMVERFQAMSNALDDKYFEFTTNLETVVGDVNIILDSIAGLNQMLLGGEGESALLDKRDSLLEELASYIHFTIKEHDDGRVDLSLGKGNSLVLGGQASHLSMEIAQGDFMRFELMIESGSSLLNVTDNVVGGIMGGLLTYQEEVLSLAHAEVGRLAMCIADAFNQQNQLGMDMNNELGIALFNDINAAEAMSRRVITNNLNTGTGAVTVGINDMTYVTTSNYELKFNSGNYSVVRLSDNEIVASGPAGAVPMTISADGLDINLDSGSFNDGDKFFLTPTRYGANEFALTSHDLNKIALASPIRVETDINNTGNVQVIATTVLDTSNASFITPGALNPPLRIEFVSETSFQIVNADTSAVIEGPITYNPSAEFAVFPTPSSYDPGYQITLTGPAHAGDQFTIDYNLNGFSDNRNGFELTQLQSEKLLNNGTTSFQQTYQQFSNRISTRTHFADIGSQSSRIMMQQSQLRRDDLSAVNMDEEAANLMRYQQAYQAAAHLLAVASGIFDMLFDAIGR